jgi:hypothetical protein
MRHDLISLVNGQPGEGAGRPIEGPTRFEQVMAEWDGLHLLVSPFTWDDCLLLVQDLDPELGEQPFLDWFDRWFDVDGRKKPGPNATLGVIHDATPVAVRRAGNHRIRDRLR